MEGSSVLLEQEDVKGQGSPAPPGRSIQAPVFSVADLQVLESPLNFQGPLLISELLEVRAGGAGG